MRHGGGGGTVTRSLAVCAFAALLLAEVHGSSNHSGRPGYFCLCAASERNTTFPPPTPQRALRLARSVGYVRRQKQLDACGDFSDRPEGKAAVACRSRRSARCERLHGKRLNRDYAQETPHPTPPTPSSGTWQVSIKKKSNVARRGFPG